MPEIMGEALGGGNFWRVAIPEPHAELAASNSLALEHLNLEIKRRTRVVETFPDGELALVLVAARLRHLAGTHWGTRRYLNVDRLRDAASTVEEAIVG